MRRLFFHAGVLAAALAVGAGARAATFVFTGAPGGDFLDETNFTENADGTGANPAPLSIEAGVAITLDLVLDGDTVVSSGDLDFGAVSGSLTLEAGSSLSIPGATPMFDNSDDLDINPDGALTLTDSAIEADDSVFLGGAITTSGGSIMVGDEVEFQDSGVFDINGTTFTAGDDVVFDAATPPENFSIVSATFVSVDNIDFETAVPVGGIVGASITSGDRIFIEQPGDVVNLVDATIEINPSAADGDIEDANGADGGTLALLGASTLVGDDVREGADLVLLGASLAALGTDPAEDTLGGDGSTATIGSRDAGLILPEVGFAEFILNGLVGGNLADNPEFFVVTPIASGDALLPDFDAFASGGVLIQAVPEPSATLLLGAAVGVAGCFRRRR